MANSIRFGNSKVLRPYINLHCQETRNTVFIALKEDVVVMTIGDSSKKYRLDSIEPTTPEAGSHILSGYYVHMTSMDTKFKHALHIKWTKDKVANVSILEFNSRTKTVIECAKF